MKDSETSENLANGSLMSDLTYQLHHLCIYEKNPRDAMWNWLKWYHGIPAFYWTGMDGFHHTDEGHVDYTFLACGGPFQLQLESPPFQFEYERKWFEKHDSGINHICWIVDDAEATIEPLVAAGCEVAMGYEEFDGVYNGFVAIDPEGRWIEIMSYVNGFKTPDVEFYPVGARKLQTLGAVQLCNDLDAMVDWYSETMGQRILLDRRSDNTGLVYMVDHTYDGRQCVNVLATPDNDAELAIMERHGPAISGALYHADDVEGVYADALSAGMEAVIAPTLDPRTKAITGTLREPSGNLIQVRERLAA